MADYGDNGFELSIRERTPEIANTSKPMRRRDNQQRTVAVAKRKAQKRKNELQKEFEQSATEGFHPQNQTFAQGSFFNNDISDQDALYALGQPVDWKPHDDGYASSEGPIRFSTARSHRRKQSWRLPSGTSFPIPLAPSTDILPVPKTTAAQKSFDFYANSYLPSILEVSPEDKMRFPQLVQSLLQDPLLFTATTTTSEAARWRTQSLFGEPPAHVMRGYGKTIAMLSERLRSERFAMTNTVMMTMAQLTAIETMTKNVAASGKHLAGMKQVMKARADSDKSGMAAKYLQAAVASWEAYFRKREELLVTSPRWRPLTYPKHPFDPALSMRIAGLPMGFGDIALSGALSHQIIDLIEDFKTYFEALAQMIEEGQTGVFESPQCTVLVIKQAAVCIDFVQNQNLMPIEQLISVALIAHVVRRDRLTPALTNLRNYFQLYCGYLSNTIGESGLPVNETDHDNDLLKWVGAVLLITSSPDACARNLALKILPKTPRPGDIIRVSQKFFWDEALSSLLVTGSISRVQGSNDVVARNLDEGDNEGKHFIQKDVEDEGIAEE